MSNIQIIETTLTTQQQKDKQPISTWLNLENVMLTEEGRHETIHCMISLVLNIHNREIDRDRKQISGC